MTTIPEGWKLVRREVYDALAAGLGHVACLYFGTAPAAPEGADMTPADARVLRKANLDLATESCRLQEALRWYAEGNHLLGTDGWESVSGEPENWLAS
jgi:hypothetical protein